MVVRAAHHDHETTGRRACRSPLTFKNVTRKPSDIGVAEHDEEDDVRAAVRRRSKGPTLIEKNLSDDESRAFSARAFVACAPGSGFELSGLNANGRSTSFAGVDVTQTRRAALPM
jgi:hypothetical protein